ncbi:MAG: prolipoprotein diacylglyceryl transferase [Hyphomicrobiaceae bacterium]|jgi:phosphatidylglycerol:prolipoprotein diacylglycerol transferase
MSLLAIPFPEIDPVALRLGPIAVKWYGLAYMAGLLLGWLYVKRLLRQTRLWPNDKAPFTPDRADDLLLFMTVGVLVGGRLGNVLFYEPAYYFNNPLEIPAVWKGGMAFHGGLIGSIIAIVLFARRVGADAWSVLDACAAATPIGLFFGRLANFINGELWGRPSSMPWAMVFPEAGPMPRHPSQLYEAALEGLVLFALLWWLAHARLALRRPGVVAGTFLAGYAVARSVCELFREPDFLLGPLSAGILYSLPMLAGGIWMIWWSGRRMPASVNVPRSG